MSETDAERQRAIEHIALVDSGAAVGDAYPKDYEPKTQPRSYQVECFNLAKSRDGFGIFFEQGLGKTKVAIDLCCHWLQQGVITKVIILCPNFVKGVWVSEIEKHSTLKMPVYVVNGGSVWERSQILNLARMSKACWIVVNYEELLTNALADLRYEVENRPCAIVADESTRIKNRAAQCTKNAVFLARLCKKRLILTGTPMAKSPLDFYAQFRFLGADLGYASFKAFQNQYCVMGGFKGYEITLWQNLDELRERVRAFSLRRTKDECLDLPDKIYQTIKLELPKESRAIYDRLRKAAYLELTKEEAMGEGRVSSTAVISKLLRLSQIAGGTMKLEDGTRTRFKQQPKLKVLLDTLDEIDESHAVIIWARFVEEVRMVAEALQEKGISCSTNYGDTPAQDRQKNIDDFQASKVRVFVGNPHAVGFGITLTKASYVIYYSNDYSYETRVQSEDRCHRIGTTCNVTYIDLICEDTVDELVKNAIDNKADLANYVVESGKDLLK
jgi:SNF2 family DNA or RNA helicase